MKTINVSLSPSYQIHIQNGSFSNANQILKDFITGRKVVIITDSVVGELYLSSFTSNIKDVCCSVYSFTFKDGENSKTISNVNDIYNFLYEKNITRSDYLIALGGGVVGDITGFCAATFLRGIKFIQIPTTLLSQVDSSVGGKTGVNLEGGKNLVGSFYQPSFVLCDPSFLDTLPIDIFNDGMAEVIKYGVCFDYNLFNMVLKENVYNCLEDIIFTCIDIKRKIVELDEKETGIRKKLNFGHTIGHAIEKKFNYSSYSHGRAVAIGMSAITSLSCSSNNTKRSTYLKLSEALLKFHLPTKCPISNNDIYELSLSDKKRTGDKITLVILNDIGSSSLIELTLDQYFKFLSGNYSCEDLI